MSDVSPRVQLIQERLAALQPTKLEIIDESEKHAGHAQAKGGGHFIAYIVAEAFAGKSLVERHRMVYSALGEAMGTEIHAFSMKTLTPEEA